MSWNEVTSAVAELGGSASVPSGALRSSDSKPQRAWRGRKGSWHCHPSLALRRGLIRARSRLRTGNDSRSCPGGTRVRRDGQIPANICCLSAEDNDTSLESPSADPSTAKPPRATLSLSPASHSEFPRCHLSQHASGSNRRFPQAAAAAALLHQGCSRVLRQGQAGPGAAHTDFVRPPLDPSLPRGCWCRRGAGESCWSKILLELNPAGIQSCCSLLHPLSPLSNTSEVLLPPTPGAFCAPFPFDAPHWEPSRPTPGFPLCSTCGVRGGRGRRGPGRGEQAPYLEPREALPAFERKFEE